MTIDLLPARSAVTRFAVTRSAVAPSAPVPVGTAHGATPPRASSGGQHGWADVEQDCPYCAGPETD